MSAVRLPNGQLYDGKYNIYDPSAVTFVERTPFLQSISATLKYEQTLEDICSVYPTKRTSSRVELYDLALFYKNQRDKGARLPKFSKWVLGMYAKREDLAKAIAEHGKAAGERKLVMSTSLIDILRSGDSPHFRSCFGLDRGSEKQGMSPVHIAEEAPGIGIIYEDDTDGKMMGRFWVHHMRVTQKNHEWYAQDVAVIPPVQIGNIPQHVVTKALRDAGVKVAIYRLYGSGSGVSATPVGGYPIQQYHDIQFQEGGKYKIDPVMN